MVTLLRRIAICAAVKPDTPERVPVLPGGQQESLGDGHHMVELLARGKPGQVLQDLLLVQHVGRQHGLDLAGLDLIELVRRCHQGHAEPGGVEKGRAVGVPEDVVSGAVEDDHVHGSSGMFHSVVRVVWIDDQFLPQPLRGLPHAQVAAGAGGGDNDHSGQVVARGGGADQKIAGLH